MADHKTIYTTHEKGKRSCLKCDLDNSVFRFLRLRGRETDPSTQISPPRFTIILLIICGRSWLVKGSVFPCRKTVYPYWERNVCILGQPLYEISQRKTFSPMSQARISLPCTVLRSPGTEPARIRSAPSISRGITSLGTRRSA